MKGFFICVIIGLLTSVNTFFGYLFSLYDRKICFGIQSVLCLLDLSFWAFFFFKLLPEKRIKIIVGIIFIFFLASAILLLYINGILAPNLQVRAIANVCKTIFCVFFYSALFKKMSSQKILDEPSFWIVTGLIFHSCISIPFYALGSYIKQQFPLAIADNIFSTANMAIIIMYFFFIKANLCKIQPHKV